MRCLMLAFLLTVACPLWAGVGAVSEVKGTACEIQRGKAKMSGLKGAEVESMDTYITGACSASITFKDDTRVKVNDNSRLLVDDFVYDPKKSDAGKLALKVGAGTVRYASGQIAKNNPQAVDVKTPTASIAVRGTDFTMTVSETGESLVVLLPSCKTEEEKKQYEMDEQRCKVGKIEVSTQAGTVALDGAFQATFVTSATQSPTPPVVVNIVESKISNNLIIIKPQEIQRAIREAKKTKKDGENDALESESLNTKKAADQTSQDTATVIKPIEIDETQRCDPTKTICVKWERGGGSIEERGRGVAVRHTPGEHYAEVKTQGYVSNSTITVIQNETVATELLGDGSSGGNTVTIKQSSAAFKR